MEFKLKDVSFRYTKGTGKGGQRKNKVETCVYAKHIPTGIEVKVDGRLRVQNKKQSIIDLKKKVEEYFKNKKAVAKKKRRDDKIKNSPVIRTYNYNKNLVKDHRSMKTTDLKRFMRGKTDLKEFSE